jgi:hypothetical protein
MVQLSTPVLLDMLIYLLDYVVASGMYTVVLAMLSKLDFCLSFLLSS